jgi:hypothetical protein
VVVAQINQTQVSALEFLQSVLVQFGFQPFKMKKAELLSTLNDFLVEQYANGRRVLLIVDEAQNLSNKVLEEIRLLSGIETTKEKVLRIILAGQPELNDKLNSPGPRTARTAYPPALPSHAAVEERYRCLHPAPPRSSRLTGPRNFRSGHLPAHLSLHRRHSPPGEHAVRHLDDGGVRPGSRRRESGGRAIGDR